jgi:hypothetical protein
MLEALRNEETTFIIFRVFYILETAQMMEFGCVRGWRPVSTPGAVHTRFRVVIVEDLGAIVQYIGLRTL